MSTAQLRTLKSALNLTRCRSHVVAEQIYLAHQNSILLHRIWLTCAEPYKGRSHVEADQNALLLHRIWLAKKTQVFTSEDDEEVWTGCSTVVKFRVLATMSRLLRGKIFCSYGSNFLKSYTFTKMTLRFSSKNLSRWRRFSLTSKKILQVAVVAGATTATVCGGIIYWSSGTIDSN